MTREQESGYMSFTGIDGSGKSAIALGVAKNLMREISVACIGSLGQPSYLTTPNNTNTILYPALSRSCRKLYDEGQREDRDPMILMAFVLHSLICHRFAEPKAVKMGVNLVIRDRDPFVDPAIVLVSYDKGFIPKKLLWTCIGLVAHPHSTDWLVHLATSPDVAIDRLQRRSFHDKHETVEVLTKASGHYDPIIQALLKQGYIKSSSTIVNNGNELEPIVDTVTNLTRNKFRRMF